MQQKIWLSPLVDDGLGEMTPCWEVTWIEKHGG
jgi:hypothetical protein